MNTAYFIVRTGMIANAIPTVNGPFEDEAAALAIAGTLQPGSYQVYGGAKPGKTFSIAAPVVSFDS